MLPLFHNGLPLAVAWTITNIVIFSAKAGFWWSITHIFQEIFKRVPRFKHCYSSAAIIRILGVFYLVAPIHHCVPRTKGWALGATLGVSVGCNSNASFCGQTLPTLPASSREELTAFENLSIPTVTFCKAKPDTVHGWQILNDFSLSKDSSFEQLSSRHSIVDFNVVFSSGRRAVTRARCDYV